MAAMKKKFTDLIQIATVEASSPALKVKWSLVADDDGNRFLSVSKVTAVEERPITSILMKIDQVVIVSELLGSIVEAMKETV